MKSGREGETLPDLFDREWIGVRDPARVNVFTDLDAVTKHLTDPIFHLVDNITQADIIFISKHFKDYKLNSFLNCRNQSDTFKCFNALNFVKKTKI